MIEVFTDEYFMKQALQEAHKALEAGEIPVGAVITAKDRIIARAGNQVERLNDATAHAEILAMTAASGHLGNKYLKDCTLYVTLEPCPMCMGGAFWSQLGRVVFGAKDPKRGYLSYSDKLAHPKTVIESGLMEEESKELLGVFFSRLRDKQ